MKEDDDSRERENEEERAETPSFRPPRTEAVRVDLWRLRPDRKHGDGTGEESAEIRRIVDRLLALVRDYRICAGRVGSSLDRKALREILTALRIESAGGAPGVLLRGGDPVETFLRESLYRELLETPVDPRLRPSSARSESERWVVEPGRWHECLDRFEAGLALPESPGADRDR